MALSSMTGFARTEGQAAGCRWHWELRSVNAKGLDVRFRLPPGMEALEPEIRNRLSAGLRRGSVQVNLQLVREQAGGRVVVNERALSEIAAVAQRLAERLGSPPVSAEGLLALRGMVEIAESVDDEETLAARNAALIESLGSAVSALGEMRAAEGARLALVLTQQVDRIEQLAQQARDNPSRKPDAVRQRIAEQVSRLLDGAAKLDPDRLHQEAVLLAARADIQEELDRLFAHVEAARGMLSSDEPVGRRLDFLAQEFHREANTLCSKAADQSLLHTGLELKAVIDQLREQVQNVE